MEDMSDIWDDLFEVKCAEDIEMLLENINSVLQKGIPYKDQSDFEELQRNLQELLYNIGSIKEETKSRKQFMEVSSLMLKKYEN